uniref:Uncharacterized protein n=1 Tax=Anopheles culicifacies TaxID=139723 RepID=A0A182MR17_9DIPT
MHNLLEGKYERYGFFRLATNAGLMVEFLEPKQKTIATLNPNRISQGGLLIDASCGMEISEFWEMTTAPEYFKGMDDRNDVHDVFTKANFPFIRELMYDLNFTLNMIQVDKGGYKHNGTFSGVMGKFQNRSAELGCMGTLMRTERLEVADFMMVTLIIKSSIIFRQPPLSIVANIFELPFSVGVWACCFGLMAIY